MRPQHLRDTFEVVVGSAVIFARDSHAALLRSALRERCVVVSSARELTTAADSRGKVAFVDIDLMDRLDRHALPAPVIAVKNRPPTEALPRTIKAFEQYPWLSHVVHASMLGSPHAQEHLDLIVERLKTGRQPLMLGANGVGRVALLNQASHRVPRLERIREFFERYGASERALATIAEVAEELMMNALFNAPVEAGFFDVPRARTEDVLLPIDRACEVSYGVDGTTAYVRVRDTFGSLTRNRLMQVLHRISLQQDVPLDESRGGAGLGMLRIFSAALAVTITVIPGALTDFMVAIDLTAGRRSVRPAAVHLFFARQSHRWAGVPVLDDQGLIEQSFTHMQSA